MWLYRQKAKKPILLYYYNYKYKKNVSASCKIIINLDSYWVCGTRRTPSYSQELHAQSSNLNRVVVLVASKCKVLSLLLGSGVRLCFTVSCWYCLPINVWQGKSREVSYKIKVKKGACGFVSLPNHRSFNGWSIRLNFTDPLLCHVHNKTWSKQSLQKSNTPCYVEFILFFKNVSTNYLHFWDCKEFIVTSLMW